MKKNKFFLAAVIILTAVIIVLVIVTALKPPALVLESADDGHKYAEYPIKNGDTFSVTFIHSVNKTPVTDVYEIRNGDIYLTETIYFGYGAGVPSELYGDQKFRFGDDGELIVYDMDTLIPDLIYVVGTVSDHTLSVNGGKEISLTQLCEKNSSVRFSCRGLH